MNMKIKNAHGIKGNEVFSKLNSTGIIGPFSDNVRALFRFLLVYCGHRASFEEFENASGNVQGVNALVRTLKQIARGQLPWWTKPSTRKLVRKERLVPRRARGSS